MGLQPDLNQKHGYDLVGICISEKLKIIFQVELNFYENISIYDNQP